MIVFFVGHAGNKPFDMIIQKQETLHAIYERDRILFILKKKPMKNRFCV